MPYQIDWQDEQDYFSHNIECCDYDPSDVLT